MSLDDKAPKPQEYEFEVNGNYSPSAKATDSHNGRHDPRIKTACLECKRRKIRCDGSHPCYSCRWYKIPERCTFPVTRPVLTVSRKNFEVVRNRLEKASAILAKLFPTSSIDSLTALSRNDLIEILHPSDHTEEVQNTSSQPNRVTESRDSTLVDDSTESRDGFATHLPVSSTDTMDYDRIQVDAGEATPNAEEDVAAMGEAGDEVNPLSAKNGRASSYVGSSSTMHLFRTILRIAPESMSKAHVSHELPTTQTSPASRNHNRTQPKTSPVPLTARMKTLINAYFTWIHPGTPILDQVEFRQAAWSGTRTDPGFLCLLYMVLALGSLGCTKTESKEHLSYYEAAKSHLDLESLGSKQIEILQALILMAGWYFHYRNRPNLASALLGVAFRMAHALGLHKESNNLHLLVHVQELRRKLWWNLVVFDAAEAVTLGRSLDTKIFDSEVHYPGHVLLNAVEYGYKPTTASLLIASIEFARVTTQVQESLLSSTTISFSEILSLDAHLVDWYESLPPYFQRLVEQTSPTTHTASEHYETGKVADAHGYADDFVQSCATMKWRYLNLRIMLYRISLMEAVMHRSSFETLTHDQRICIRKCLTLSGETIASVATRSAEKPNQYIAWPATWYLLQVSIVPLLCLYTFRTEHSGPQGAFSAPPLRYGSLPGSRQSKHTVEQVRQIRDDCHSQIQTTLRLMKEMEPWAVASKRMHDLIKLLYEARHQALRVWNNSEDSPMVVLGTPSAQHHSDPGAEPAHRQAMHPGESRRQSVNWSATTAANATDVNNPGQPPQPQEESATDAMNHNQQFSRDWSTYDPTAWLNVSWESLFELPFEFHAVDMENLDMT